MILEKMSITRLNIQLTKKCNQRCCSCNSYELWEDNELTLEDIKRVIKEACGMWKINNIALTGGEPTIRSDILEIARTASRYSPNVSITTNGYFFANKDKALEMVRGGVNRYSFSYHGIGKHDKFTNTNGAEERIRKAISWISEEKKKNVDGNLYAKIGILFDGENIDDVEKMLDYAESKDMDLYIEIVDKSIALFNKSKLAQKMKNNNSNKEIIYDALEKIRLWMKTGRRIIMTEKGVEYIERYYMGQTVKGGCPLGLTDIYIESNGDVKTGCWILPPVGNVKTESLYNIQDNVQNKINIQRMLKGECPCCTCGYLMQAKYMDI